MELIKAAKIGNLDDVNRLIEANADIHAGNDDALRWAAHNGNLNVVKQLLKANANVNAGYFSSPLIWAVKNEHLDVVEVLIKAGSDVNKNNDYALQLAAKNNDFDTVEVLLNAGSKYNPEWEHISDDIRQFIEDNQPLGMKSALKVV